MDCIKSFTAICVDLAKSKYAHAHYSKLRMRNLPLISIFTAMASAKPHRTKAYSNDLRWRMVWQREVFGIQPQGHQYGPQCGPQHTVWRVVKFFRETGCVDKKGYPHERAFHKLTASLELTIINLFLSRPGIYLGGKFRWNLGKLWELKLVLQLYADSCTKLASADRG